MKYLLTREDFGNAKNILTSEMSNYVLKLKLTKDIHNMFTTYLEITSDKEKNLFYSTLLEIPTFQLYRDEYKHLSISEIEYKYTLIFNNAIDIFNKLNDVDKNSIATTRLKSISDDISKEKINSVILQKTLASKFNKEWYVKQNAYTERQNKQ